MNINSALSFQERMKLLSCIKKTFCVIIYWIFTNWNSLIVCNSFFFKELDNFIFINSSLKYFFICLERKNSIYFCFGDKRINICLKKWEHTQYCIKIWIGFRNRFVFKPRQKCSICFFSDTINDGNAIFSFLLDSILQ